MYYIKKFSSIKSDSYKSFAAEWIAFKTTKLSESQIKSTKSSWYMLSNSCLFIPCGWASCSYFCSSNF